MNGRSLTGLIDLAEDPELSIKLDRWILVESCKQLHNFITQYPEAKTDYQFKQICFITTTAASLSLCLN